MIKKKLDQHYKIKTWTLIYRDEIKAGHRALRKKWVYRIKYDVNKNVVYFKAR